MRATLVLVLVLVLPRLAAADSVRLENGSTFDCTVLQDTPKNVTILYHSGVLRIARSQIESVAKDDAESTAKSAEERTPPRLPDHRTTVVTVAARPWATDFQQIPATVIDTGVMENIPYKSHRAGRDYGINVYGDPDSPAAFEIGLHHALIDNKKAKRDCIECVCTLLGNEADRTLVRGLSLEKEKKVREGMTFEVTPPDAPDAYGCWWISVYDEERSQRGVRASRKELEAITVAKSRSRRGRAARRRPMRTG